MNFAFYKITTKSNTHVGSGQNNYGIVDNIVQKDYLTEFPCINSTSLKGALREYVEEIIKDDNLATTIFGSKPTEKDNSKLSQGSHYFHQAFLLSFPMRSNTTQFFNATCPLILQDVKLALETCNKETNKDLIYEIDELLKITIEPNNPISDTKPDAIIEKHGIKTNKTEISFSANLKSIFGNPLIIMHNDTFQEIVKKLPIITRNQLENGQSANLFYEEVVPRETRFGFLLAANSINDRFDAIKSFQIGANATVGYGYCSLNKIV